MRVPGFIVVGGLALGATLLGCAAHTAHSPVYAAVAPPPMPVELEGSAPSPAYVWLRGHYFWNGVEYVWIPGHWETRPHTRAEWISGQWHRTPHGWVWVDGHWT